MNENESFIPTGESFAEQALEDVSPNTFDGGKTAAPAAAGQLPSGNKDLSVYGAAIHNRYIVNTASQSPGFPFLPDERGLVRTDAPINVINGTRYHGPNYITLKAHAALRGFETLEYITENQLEKANELANAQLSKENKGELHGTVKEGADPVIISILNWEKENEKGEKVKLDKPETKFIKLFNIEDCLHPEAVRMLAELAAEKRLEYPRQRHAENEAKAKEEAEKNHALYVANPFVPRKKDYQHRGLPIYIASADPETYIATCMTAASIGRDCKVSPETAEQFTQKLRHYLYRRDPDKTEKQQPQGNAMNVVHLGNNASQQCKIMLKEHFAKKEAGQTKQSPARAVPQPSIGM